MTTCEVCDGPGEPVGYAGLRRCAACTHVWADLSLDAADLARLYQRSYFFGDEYGNYVEDRRIIEKNFAGRLATLRRFVEPQHRRLFELGCAYGFFLNAARPLFGSVQGIDVSEDGVRYAKEQLGLDVLCGDLLTLDQPPACDVACLWDTIEHLARPRRYLETIASQMPSGGLVAITTGDIASFNARLQKGRWRLIHPPTHLHYFTSASLARLLDRCGFRVVHLEWPGMYRSAGGMLHNVFALKWKQAAIGAWLKRAVPARLDVYLNLHDIMFIIAEHR